MLRSMFIGNHRRFSGQIHRFSPLRSVFTTATPAEDESTRHKIKPDKAESPNRQKNWVAIGESALLREGTCPRIAGAFLLWCLEQGGYVAGGMLVPLRFIDPTSAKSPEIGCVEDTQKRASSTEERGPSFPPKRLGGAKPPKIGGVEDAQKRVYSTEEAGPNFPSKRLVRDIAGDNDARFTGHAAAFGLARRRASCDRRPVKVIVWAEAMSWLSTQREA